MTNAMQNITQSFDIPFFIFIELTITWMLVQYFTVYSRLDRFHIFHMRATITNRRNVWVIWIHFLSILFHKYFKCCDVSSFFLLVLFCLLFLFFGEELTSEISFFLFYFIWVFDILWLVSVWCSEISTFSESLKHTELINIVNRSRLLINFRFMPKIPLFKFLLIDSIILMHNIILLWLLLFLFFLGNQLCSNIRCLGLTCILLTQFLNNIIVSFCLQFYLIIYHSWMIKFWIWALNINNMGLGISSYIWRIIFKVVKVIWIN